MQNPELIEQISSLMRTGETESEQPSIEEAPVSISEQTVRSEKASAEPLMKSHRRELLNAMKPYLSENRRSAIDSMSSILDVIDVMIKR